MEAPEKLGKYSILSEISRGSMGTVYLGHDPYINRHVAVKVAQTEAIDTKNKERCEVFKKMFFNEAHTAGSLTHPNIISIYDAGADGDTCYIVMELVEGGNTLTSYCTKGNLLPLPKIIEIIFKCAKALDYAHNQNIIHRDIKPSNILIREDMEVQIADFGIAKIKKTEFIETAPGFIGSPKYMSPEQLNEGNITYNTDLFSLGIIMYEMLVGEHPFEAGSFSKLIGKILHEDPHPLKKVRPDLPPIIIDIFNKALQKDTANRYQTGLEFATDLSRSFDILDKIGDDISYQEKFNRIRQSEFFQGFPEEELHEIMKVGLWHEYAMKADIIAEGDIDDCFYIITEGQVGVLKKRKPISVLNVGDCFGEMGYLTKTQRTATIKALTKVSIVKINSTAMTSLPANCQIRFLKVFLRTLINRLSMTTGESIR